jgi:hypothetical protein
VWWIFYVSWRQSTMSTGALQRSSMPLFAVEICAAQLLPKSPTVQQRRSSVK